MPGDFLHELIAGAAAAAMEGPGAVGRFERALRKKIGGSRRYIAKTAPSPSTGWPESPRLDATPPGKGERYLPGRVKRRSGELLRELARDQGGKGLSNGETTLSDYAAALERVR